jgi:hypothetical protein
MELIYPDSVQQTVSYWSVMVTGDREGDRVIQEQGLTGTPS